MADETVLFALQPLDQSRPLAWRAKFVSFFGDVTAGPLAIDFL
jgi:hypothetical protein